MNLDANCLSYSNNSFQQRSVSCLQCAPNYLIQNLTKPKTTCSSFDPIVGCKVHDKTQTTVNNFLKCLECNSEFYLDNNTCKTRTLYNGCASYDPLADKCLQCNADLYLNRDQNACFSMPNGVLNCHEYLSETVCRQCKTGFYLFSNQCLPVTMPITGCTTYSDSVTCVACDASLLLYDNKCLEKKVQCLTYASPTECQSCPA